MFPCTILRLRAAEADARRHPRTIKDYSHVMSFQKSRGDINA